MKKRCFYSFIILLALLTLSTVVLGYFLNNDKVVIERYNSLAQLPRISPDYSDTVIPPNIAPLNFMVKEPGSHYYIKIYSENGEPIEVSSRSAKFVIPLRRWHELLDKNKGRQLKFDVFVKAENGQWDKFKTINNKIAKEDIDGVLVYRKMYPAHYWIKGKVGLYQRNLSDFDEKLILDGSYYHHGCINCHTFCQNDPKKMLVGIRSDKHNNSTLLVDDGTVKKIGTKFSYTSWHPSGRMATFSVNNVAQFFHTSRDQVREAVDLDSMLAYFLVDSGQIKTSPKFSRKDRLETYPTWSPDGKYLYFCSAPISQLDNLKTSDNRYSHVKYDLVRISYDLQNDQWGELETILSARDTNKTALLPRISFDGRWLLLCMPDSGCFPAFSPSSDLYLVDLQSPRQAGRYNYRRLDINSDQSESWHSWLYNSRWIVFSSKRDSGVFTRLYISHVDQQGKVSKPILLPQKDPEFYDSALHAYNTPEFIIEPITVRPEELAWVVRGSRRLAVEMPITMATPDAEMPPGYQSSWQQSSE